MLAFLQFVFSSPWVFLGMIPILLIAQLAWRALVKGVVDVVTVIVTRNRAQ